MLMLIIVLFALAALLGVYLLSFILQNKNTPKGVAFVHGPLAGTALIILIIYCLMYSAPLLSLLIFIFAALLGFTLIFRDLTGKSIPKWLAIGHGVFAIVGFLFLLIFAIFK